MTAHTISAGTTGTFALGSGDTLAVLSGGTAVNTTVGSRATETVAPNGVDRGATVSGILAMQLVNGSASGTAIVSGGEQLVGSAGVGGSASGATVFQSSMQIVDNTGSATGTTLSGGYQFEFSGGTVAGTTVDSGGTLVFGGGILSGTTVNSGGMLELMLTRSGTSGQFVGTNAVRTGGTVAAGGAVTGALQSGFVITDNTPITGISGGIASGVTVAVLSQGTTSGLLVGNGGFEVISSGGAARATVVAGGSETILTGGSATGVTLSGGTVTVMPDASLAGTLSFAGPGGWLVISGGSAPSAMISGFAAGDTIRLANLSASSASYANGVLSLFSGGAAVASLDVAGPYATGNFSLSPDGSGGTDITGLPLLNDLGGDGEFDALMTYSTGALVLDDLSGGEEQYTQIGALGPEWQFEGEGEIAADGKDQFLLWYGTDDSPIYGALVLGEDDGGAASYTQVGAIGPEWQFEGVGPIAGGSASDVLLWYGTNDSPLYGALVIGADIGGSMSYSEIGSLGPEWQFEGVGDFAGDGKTGFLVWDTGKSSPIYGAVIVGEDVGGMVQYTSVGGLDPATWQFEGSGDLLGHGQTDFLIWDGNSGDPNHGALVVGEVTHGTAQYTLIGDIGPEWNIVGVGDYDGKSDSEFLMRSGTSGALVIGTIANGTANYTPVGGVGSEWNFHTTDKAALA